MSQIVDNLFGESVWKRLQKRNISREAALELLVDNGDIDLEELDADLHDRFFNKFPDRSILPPVIPLLLWQSCFDLGSPITLSNEQKELIRHRIGAKTVNIIPIKSESYIRWFRRQRILNPNTIDSSQAINPLTGEVDQVDISETTDLYLSQAVDQTRRINALISIALQHRASDIHLEPTPTGLRVRYRID